MARGGWVYVGGRAGNKPSPGEKSVITTACETFIADVLTPRFLPEICPSTEFNFPVAIYGKWLGNKYRFITRYRSDGPGADEPEFDAPFARLEYVSRDRFDLSYHRHTGEWLCLFERLTLTEALHMIESIPNFAPR
ncbi:MAG TPA: hypothetical protein VND19_02130 [Acetobacteraceae bacterium]|nr:hypothetical protein [Acetobacteraceae bacterium]